MQLPEHTYGTSVCDSKRIEEYQLSEEIAHDKRRYLRRLENNYNMEEESLSKTREHSEVLREEVRCWTGKVADERRNLEAQRRSNQKCNTTKLRRLQRELKERNQQLRITHDKMGQIQARVRQMD